MTQTRSRSLVSRLWSKLTHRGRGRYDDANASDPYRVPTMNPSDIGAYDHLTDDARLDIEKFKAQDGRGPW